MNTGLTSTELSPSQYEKIAQYVYSVCRIQLHKGKEELVKSRLTKRLRALNLENFEDYLDYLERDRTGHEHAIMVDRLTTNKTSFFREEQHFDYIRRNILPDIGSQGHRMRLWSAGCSSGEEPYSLGILLCEEIPDIQLRDVRILATDISTDILDTARQAVYEYEKLEPVSPSLIQKYFIHEKFESSMYRVCDAVRKLVRFARLNLMDSWPMAGNFDAILCRNVMIYFDKPTQEHLVNRFWELLKPDGHLFVGHSESLVASSHRFRYVQPAVYVK